MSTLQSIVESLRDGFGADLVRHIAAYQNPDVDSDDAMITAEDVFNILARAKKRQPEGPPESVE